MLSKRVARQYGFCIRSSIGRALVSKTRGSGFEALRVRHKKSVTRGVGRVAMQRLAKPSSVRAHRFDPYTFRQFWESKPSWPSGSGFENRQPVRAGV